MKLNENIEIFNGDCLEVMKDIKDKSVDLILCDLPYGTTSCSWDIVIPFEPLWEQYNRIIKDGKAIVLFGSEPFSSALRVSNLKDYKYDWVWDKNSSGSPTLAHIMPLKIHELISVFYKSFSGNNHGCFMNLREYLFDERKKSGLKNKEINQLLGNQMAGHYFTYGGQWVLPVERDYKLLQSTGFFQREYADLKREYEDFNVYNPQGLRYVGKLVKAQVPNTQSGLIYSNHLQKYTGYPKSIIEVKKDTYKIHPTQKPVELLEYLIKTYTYEDALVLDNCMGSGSTGVACVNTNRKFVGIEKDESYFNISKQRLEDVLNH